MNNERYNQIIDEAYEEYFFKIKTLEGPSNENDVKSRSFITDTQGTDFHTCETFTKKEFINKCKADSEFSKRWGLKIEEIELTWEEQVQWVMKNTDVEWENLYIAEEIAKDTTPKRLLTVTYNNEKIEVYE